MKIYLINPKFPVTYWGFEHSNDLSGAKYTTPPLALATIAGLTPGDVTVEICDENVTPIDFETDADIIGLTAYLVQGERAFEIAAEFRKHGKTVVLGGPITSLSPENCTGKVDVVFRGEAEYTWPQFLRDYRAGAFRAEYVQKDKINMHDSPVPRLDLVKLERYSHAAIQTTRGCPFGCEFCDIIVLFGRKVRCKSVEQILAEMRAAFQQGVTSIFFTDDNFIGNRKYAKELLRAIIALNKTINVPMQYMTQVSIDLAQDEELLQLMYEAHFNKVFIGIESPRKSCLAETNKGQNVRSDLVADVRKIQSYNIDVSAGMIVGFDHDDADIFKEQFDFIMESNIAWAMTGMLQAVPKTPLYERLKQEHRLDTSNEAVTNTSLNVNIIPKKMTQQELIAGYHWLLKQLYSYENYAKRVIGNLKTYTKKPQIKISPSFAEIKIVLRTLRYYLLTWDRKRRHFYLRIMKYVLLHKPYAFYDAMVHLVSFKHLHTYVYEHLEQAFSQKTIEFERSFTQSKHAIMTAYEDLRKHAATFSMQATAAYEDVRAHFTELGQHATGSYDQVCQQAATLSQQATQTYDELRKYAGELSQLATMRYELLRQQATHVMNTPNMMAEYEKLREQFTTLSTQITAACEDLRKQALTLSTQATTLSQQAAALYEELARQASVVGQRVALLREEFERTFAANVPLPSAG